MNKLITVNIRRPLYNNFCYINSSVIDLAIKRGAKLEVIIPKGKAIIDPREWKAKGNRMEKVFKYPGNPMILFGNNVNIENQQRLL